MKNYNVALDIGTGSVGFAVVDNNGKLLKKGNKNLWGANLFDGAQSAQSTRMYRATKRRYLRRRQRVNLLRDIMSIDISPLDENFYRKLDLSYMISDDKKSSFKDFNEESYLLSGLMTEKEYNKKYPTIYHLREELIKSKEKKDPRLIYLALHHMIKYRGNFLYEGQKINLSETNKQIEQLEFIVDSLNEIFEDGLNDFDYNDFSIKLGRPIARMEIRQDAIDTFKKQGFGKEVVDALTEVTKAILGYEFNLDKIFLKEDLGKIVFSDENIETKIDEASSKLDDQQDILIALQDLYSIYLLKRIVGDTSGTISSSMVASYDKHKSDLVKLKDVLIKYYNHEDYKDMFSNNSDKNLNYYAYINKPSKCKLPDLYAKIKKVLKDNNSDEAKEILREVESNSFLLKQNSTSNGVIPVQLNLEEMKIILENQGVYYPSLKENKEKIEKILLFRIPYYVGPLNQNSKWSWVEKKSNEKITPWNFDTVINKEETAKKFIDRMKSHCTYLLAEPVLPKNSLIITKYEVLSELNQLKVDGFRLSTDEKKEIINGLFLEKGKITKKDLIQFLIDKQHRKEITEITGFQKENEFATSLKPYIDFKNIFGDTYLDHEEDIERIIEWLTVYNEKDIIHTRIKNEFSYITADQLKKILAKNYKGYSRLSEKLLNGLIGRDDKGNPCTIIELLENSPLNLMQIINKEKYGFKDLIDEENDLKDNHKISYDDISCLAGSPALKRGIWQSVKILEDFRKYFKCDPANIFIEFAREEDKNKKRSIPRNKMIKSIYEKMIKEEMVIDGEKITKNHFIYKELDNLDANNEKVLLYILQNGKSMYSGKKLDFENLSNYDVDHVLPQAYIKDNSIDNKVLVLSEENREKSDDLLLKPEIINKMRAYWLQLLNAGLISKKKYFNLTRTTISDNERVGFVNKQLVETRQIIKHVAHLVKNFYDSNVFSVKASLGSEFRDKYNLYKIRNLNKTHHAHDAYLCARIGMFITKKYPDISLINEVGTYNKIENEIAKRIKESIRNRGSNANLSSFVIQQMSSNEVVDKNTGELIWEGTKEIEYIKKIFNYKDYFLTYKTDYGTGKFYDETIQGVDKTKHSKSIIFPLKANKDPMKYGGYASAKQAYGFVIKYKKGKKIDKKLVSIPIIFSINEKNILSYIEKHCGFDEFVIGQKIPLGLPIIMNGTKFTLNSMNELRIIEQIFLNDEDKELLYFLMKGKLSNDYVDPVKKLLVTILNKISSKAEFMQKNNETIINYITKNEVNIDELFKIINSVLYGLNQGCININSNENKLKIIEYGRRKVGNVNIDSTVFMFESTSGIYRELKKL
ncbi:MAG: type II CRISPR RNA-guided endonuclease Cas9 [Erysipelotrichaceae bacterium]